MHKTKTESTKNKHARKINKNSNNALTFEIR